MIHREEAIDDSERHSSDTPEQPRRAQPDLAEGRDERQAASRRRPALRGFLLQLAEAQAAGDVQRVAAQIEAAIGPLQQVILARQALTQAQQALTEGYTSVTQSASDPAQLAEAAAVLAALADDVAGRAQQLAALLQS